MEYRDDDEAAYGKRGPHERRLLADTEFCL